MGTCTSKQSTVVVPVTIKPASKPFEVLPATESWSTLDAQETASKLTALKPEMQETPETVNGASIEHIIPQPSGIHQVKTEVLSQDPESSHCATLHDLKNKEHAPEGHRNQRPAHYHLRKPVSHQEGKMFLTHNVSPHLLTPKGSPRNSPHVSPHASPQVSPYHSRKMKPRTLISYKKDAKKASVSKAKGDVTYNQVDTAQNQAENEVTNHQESVKQPGMPDQLRELSTKDVANAMFAVAAPEACGRSDKPGAKRTHTNELNTTDKQDGKYSVLNQVNIDVTIPQYFHPEQPQCKQDIVCQQTLLKLAPVESETALRDKLQHLLMLWKESGQLTEIENHGLSVSSLQASSIECLAEALTAPNAKYITSLGENDFYVDVAKAYVIYFWVANNITYDVKSWQAYLEGNDYCLRTESQTVLQERQSVCFGYANLYKTLGRKVNLEVRVIEGNTKSWRLFSEDAGAGFSPSRSNAHSWNVVKLGGVWFPLDCTFGSGFLDSSMHFNRVYSQDYFAAPPEQWVFTHWPQNASWQLLQVPLTLEEVQPLIPVSMSTFALGVEPQTWTECICIPKGSVNPTVTVRFNNSNLLFSAKLVEQVKRGDSQHITLESSGFIDMIFIQRTGTDVTVRAAIPHTGDFTLNVYAHKTNDSQLQNAQLCLSYHIQCDVCPHSHVGYPTLYNLASPAFDFELLHWNIPEKAYISESTTGKVDIVFQAQPGLRFYHTLISGKSKGPNDSASSDIYSYRSIIICNPNNPNLYMLRVVFPCEGWWTVYLCASDNNCTSGYTALLNYHIFAKVGFQDLFYPHLLSHDVHLLSPEPLSSTGNEILVVPFRFPELLDLHCYQTFEQVAGESIEECTQVEYLGSSSPETPSNHIYQLKIIFPKPGRWYTHVFAKKKSDSTQKSYTGLFNICANVKGALENTLFPYFNSVVSESLNMKLFNRDSVTFADDGKPFTFHFLAPQQTDFLHLLEPICEHGGSTHDHSGNDERFLQHCTLLSSEASGNLSTYTLSTVFPYASKWALRLFGSTPNSSKYELILQFVFNVSNPMPNVGYVKVFPGSQQLGVSIPAENLLYQISCDSAQFELPFNAPDHIHFVWNMQLHSESEKHYQQAFVHYLPDHSPNHILHMVFPKPGEWVCHLFAKQVNNGESDRKQKHYQSILELRIQANTFADHLSFPQIFEPFRTSFDMQIRRSTLPLISKVGKLPSTLTIPFYSPPSVKFWHDANVANRSEQSVTRMISDLKTGLHELIVDITELGCWTISLYAQDINSPSKTWTAVLRHIVIAE